MNYISHKSRETASEGTAFSFACGDIILRDPGQVFKSNWVRPEDLVRYEKITRFFKIVGRDMLGYGWVTRENLEDLGRYGTIAAIEARFGGRYPRCPAFAERPTETPTETRRNHDTADQNLARA